MKKKCVAGNIVVFVFLLFLPIMASANYYGEKDRFVETGVTKKSVLGITDEGSVFIYKKKSGKLLKQFDKKYFFINCGVSSNGEFAALIYKEKDSNDLFADIIETDRQKVAYHFTLASQKRSIDKIELSNNGRLLFVMGDYVSNPNMLYSTVDGQVLYAQEQTTSFSNALSPDGKYFILTDYTMLKGSGIRGNFGFQVFEIDSSAKTVSPIRKIKLNKLKLAIRKHFGKIEPIITSHTFSELDHNLLFMNYTFKKDKRYQDFVVKLDLESGQVKGILDYGMTEKTSSHWNDSYLYDNTLCELSDDLIAAGYEGKIYVGDFLSNTLVSKVERHITMGNDTPPDVACFPDDKTFAFSDTRSELKKPAIYLMKYKNDEVVPLVSKVGGKQLEQARKEAKIAAEKRRKEEEAARIAAEKAKKKKLKRILKSLKQKKEVGDFVCLAGKKGFWFIKYDVMLKAYVERVSGKKIQLRITDSAQNAVYNDVTLYRDSIIWDRYDSWYDCSLNN